MIPAVSYLRMSKESQDTSIHAQRVAIAAFAKANGYKIIREYRDEGISGDATEKRTAFQKMLKDVSRGDFKAVLCWDQDRFGRFDILEAGVWIKPMRDAGVQLVTMAQGVINWNDFAGRLVYSVQQEGKHQFLRDISRNVNRGKIEAVKTGRWMGGFAPYGYQIGSDGHLEPHPEHSPVVKRIFSWYAGGKTMRWICKTLNTTGVVSPQNKLWSASRVSHILSNEAYLGRSIYNQKSRGKYTAIAGGSVIPKANSEPIVNDREEWLIVENTHSPLVTQATFDKAQECRKLNRKFVGPATSYRVLFRGILRCGYCGATMSGAYIAKLKDTVYLCSGYNISGKCHQNRTYQRPLLDMVLEQLQLVELNPKSMAKSKAAVLAKFKDSRPTESPAVIQAKRNSVDKRLTKAQERLIEVPRDMIPVVSNQIRELREQLESLDSALKLATLPRNRVSDQIDQWLDDLEKQFKAILNMKGTPECEEMAQLLRATFSTVEVRSRKNDGGYSARGKWRPNGCWELVAVKLNTKTPEILH